MSQQAVRDYLRVAGGGDAADADLLARFAACRDEAAFELLVWRHAALVQRVCRAVLCDHHAAEDAAQAAFLVLARKAHTFSGRGSVVGWLYRVARRIAVRLAKDRARRPVTAAGLDRLAGPAPAPGASADEVAALCAEVDRLPERYRVPVLLCFFEGLTHAEAARRTGWPVGSVAGRLARAKDLLARRLSRRGVGVAGVALGVPVGSFVGHTARAAAAFADRGAVVPGVDPSVPRLAEGALTVTTTTWKLVAAAAAVVFAAAGVWGFAPHAGPQDRPPPARPQPAAAAQPAGERTADAAQRVKSQNNLKQILLAIHSYHDAVGHMPRNFTDAAGKPLLSWRVAILPYIEQENLYRQFKLDEPWDSEHNKKLLAQMPPVYRVGFEPKDATTTHYQGFAGPGTVFEPGKKITLAGIPDGTANTLAVVEAGPPVEWTKPADLPYDPKKPPKLEKPFANVLHAAMGDGSAHPLKPDLDETTLRRLIERDDGQPIGGDIHATFPATPAELKGAQEMLGETAKLFDAVAGQLREQQKLIEEYAKRNPKAPLKVDLSRQANFREELESVLRELKRETEELRRQVEKK